MVVGMLALPPLGDWEDNGPVVYSGIGELRQKLVQNAGRAFFDRYEYSGSTNDGDPDDDGDASDEEQDVEEDGKKRKKKPAKERDNALKLSDMLKGVDLYGLMEVDEGASQDDLKKSYRKLCLTHHPDKQAQPLNEKAKEEMNKKFLKLQEAYEILSDVKKRRKYDSMGTFDDSVPSQLKKGQDFFDVFGAAFSRNSKWSERKPVPDLGDAGTPFEKVDKFYNFWRGFQSWRDLDEQIMEEEGEDCFMKLDDAECREERRWMERENQKLRAKAQKAERARILRLVENAEKFDPRVIAEKERKRLLREAEKAEKDAKRAEVERKLQEDKERKAAKERELEEARKEEKKKKDEERQAKKAARAKLRKQIKDLDLSIMEDQLQDFLLSLESVDIEALTITVSTKKVNGEAVFETMRAKGFEPIIVSASLEDEQTTAEGSAEASDAEEEEQDPEKQAELERLAKEKRREQIRKAEERDLELKKIREEEAIRNAEEKKIRDAKKKVDQERKDAERRKDEKKAAELKKKEDEKKRKALEQAEAKAVAEKLANKQQAEAMKSQALQEREQAEQMKQQEHVQMEFERDRLARSEELEKMEWSAVVERSSVACASPEVTGPLAAAKALEGEELIDAQLACLGSVFVVGVRLDQDAPGVSSTLRNRMKKLRAKLRTAVEKGELAVEPAAGSKADKKGLERLLRIGVGLEMESKAAPPEAPESAPEAPAKKKAKAKAKAAAKPEDEDLDALLSEFGVEIKAKKPKNKKK